MAGLFTADIENRGLVLDPRTKMIVMITLVVFALGGTGSNIAAVRYGTVAVSILPLILLMTAKQYKKAAVFGLIFALVKCAELGRVDANPKSHLFGRILRILRR